MKRFLRAAGIGTAITVLLAATFHLLLLFVVAVLRGDTDALNPVSFLGLHLVFDGLESSNRALVIGWIVLVGIGIMMTRLVLMADTILALWYTSATYNKIASQSKQLRRTLTKLDLAPGKGFKIRHIKSINVLFSTTPEELDDKKRDKPKEK